MGIVTSERCGGAGWRHLAAVALLLLSVAATPVHAVAQPAPQPQMSQPVPPSAPPADNASFGRSARKAATYKMASGLTGLALFSYGTGSIWAGLGLAAFNTAQGWFVYTGTDYLYDRYWPNPQSTSSTFDVANSAERNTWKFLIYRGIAQPIKFLSLYVYTGSAATAVTIGSASLLINSLEFYVNSVVWDWIDWRESAAPSGPEAQPPRAEPIETNRSAAVPLAQGATSPG